MIYFNLPFKIILIIIPIIYSCEQEAGIHRTAKGNIISIGDSIDGVREGEWIIMSNRVPNIEQTTTSSVINYKNGKRHGISIIKHRDKQRNTEYYGDIDSEYINWKIGKKHGLEYEIHTTGDSLVNCEWINGKIVGNLTRYFPKEAVEIQIKEYKKGDNLTDIFESFEDRTLPARIKYQQTYDDKGIANGNYVHFNVLGVLTNYGTYIDGKDCGGTKYEVIQHNSIDATVSIGRYERCSKDGVWTKYIQKFKYEIREYEPTDKFFQSQLSKINRKDILSEITYKLGKVIKERFYKDNKVFYSQKTFDKYTTDIFNKRFHFEKTKDEPKKKSTYSY